jgi:hypothetical protein
VPMQRTFLVSHLKTTTRVGTFFELKNAEP